MYKEFWHPKQWSHAVEQFRQSTTQVTIKPKKRFQKQKIVTHKSFIMRE